jgi:hypothetical protein
MSAPSEIFSYATPGRVRNADLAALTIRRSAWKGYSPKFANNAPTRRLFAACVRRAELLSWAYNALRGSMERRSYRGMASGRNVPREL